MPLSGGTTLKNGRYEILRQLARGGFGFIYQALDHRSGERVVLKELHPVLAADPQVQRRFVREGQTLQRLRHPNIARVDATFEENDTHYIVLEFLAGGSLTDRLQREGRLSLAEAVRIALALCAALEYLHQRGITHCDLNPGNILFDAAGTPKLIDLGVAHVPETFVRRAWHTEHGFTMGTIAYMAPEQLLGERDDPRIDVYALAAVLYQVLSGTHYLQLRPAGTPFARAENVRRVRVRVPVPIAGVSDEVNQVLLSALDKDPDARPQGAAALGRVLIRAAIPHLPADQALTLIAALYPAILGADAAGPPVPRPPEQAGTASAALDDPPHAVPFPAAQAEGADADRWPAWVWITLATVNAAVMGVLACLVLRLF